VGGVGSDAANQRSGCATVNVTLLLVLVVISSFVIGRIVARLASRYVALSGAEYMLVGVLIGPHVGLGLIHEGTLEFVRPLISLLLGLSGFLVGLRGRDAIARPRVTLIGFGSALGVVALCGVCLLPLLVNLVPAPRTGFVFQRELYRSHGALLEIYVTSTHLWLALCLGAAAAVTSSVLIEGLRRIHAAAGPVTDLLQAAARASQLTAVIVLGLVLATTRATQTGGSLTLSVWQWGLFATLGSVVCGLLFGWFLGKDEDPNRIFLASVGLVTFAAGAGAVLAVSPLFVNALAGLTVATTSKHAERLRRELDRLQHVLFVLLMIFAGTMWSPVRGALWLLPLVYVLARFLARRLVMGVWSRLLLVEHVPRLGNAFLGQGTLATAIGVDFSMRFPQWQSLVLTTVLFGTLLSELFSQRVTRRLLADVGELGNDVNLAPEVVDAPSGGAPSAKARAGAAS
jgi:Kef-type K+ transport system membrane component KefB